MTAQAMTLSLEQQTQQRRPQAPAQAPGAASQTPAPAISPKPKKALAPQEEPERELESVGASLEETSQKEHTPQWPSDFQQKREYFQRLGQQQIKVKMVKPPAKVQIPRGEAQEEMQEEEEPRAGGGEMGEGRTLPFCSAHGLMVSRVSFPPGQC